MAKNRKQRRYFPSQQANRPARFLRRARVEIDRGLAWFCVWTQARAEQRARDDLERAGFATYLPTQALEIVKRGRLVEIERVPVSRYLFVGLDASAPEFERVGSILDGWQPSGWFAPVWLGSLLRVAGEPIRVGAGALQAHADECTGNGLVGIASGHSPLRRYQTARIVSGPLSGLAMQVSDVLCDERVRGLVEMLGGKVVVEATVDQLEAA